MKFFRQFSGILTRISLEKPPRCDVLQFSGEISALTSLKSVVNLSRMPSVGEKILLSVAFRSLMCGRFNRWGYYTTFAECTGARLVLVWHDTNIEAYELQYHIGIPVWCIQNGLRHDVAPSSASGFLTNLGILAESRTPRVAKYLTFGDSSTELLSRHAEAHFVQSGSFRLNEYLSQRTSQTASLKRSQQRIGFVVSFPNKSDVPNGTIWNNQSTFVKVNGRSISYHDYFSLDALVARSLFEVAVRHAMYFSIIGKRSPKDSVERDFFSQAPGCDGIDVVSHEKGSGYEVADTYDYLFTVDSTLGYEMLAAKKKVGFISNRFQSIGIETCDMTFGYPLVIPKDGLCWTSATNRQQISLFAERLLKLSDEAWKNIDQELTPRLMVADPGNRTFHVMLLAELGLQ